MLVSEWLGRAKEKVGALDAELILCAALAVEDRAYLAAHGEDELSVAALRRADKMLRRRAAGEPLAYILGYKEFYGRRFKVNRRVLIPRPETEAVVRLALSELGARRSGRRARVLEVGTGSGCIAITLAAELGSRADIVATDKSPAAVLVAGRNAVALLGDDPDEVNLKIINSNLLRNVEGVRKFDLVVANLPYVDKKWDWLDRKTLGYEPRGALYAGDGGLSLVKRLIDQLRERGYRGGLILEADECQHERIAEYVGCEPKAVDGLAMLF